MQGWRELQFEKTTSQLDRLDTQQGGGKKEDAVKEEFGIRRSICLQYEQFASVGLWNKSYLKVQVL